MTNTPESAAAAEILSKLESAWNASDGTAFGAQFAEDAQFVDIRGDYHQGRTPIAKGHQALLDSIYKGSSVRYELIAARALTADVIVAHASATLNAPIGPLAGTNRSVFSYVLTRSGDRWEIASFHNTLVQG